MPFLLASHKNKTAAFKLSYKRKEVTIGRDLSNDMPLPLSRISFAHACISYKGEHWYLRDLGSSNGTKVNSVRIKGKVQIKDGDRIRMGNVRMKFVDSVMIPDGIKRL
ncbi:FHA domain-containing protein, partial [bacterium AH-315-I18]|nr:FHA domain-containing protein [bacterium AH-315-I18]